jgi:hypothetical protein
MAEYEIIGRRKSSSAESQSLRPPTDNMSLRQRLAEMQRLEAQAGQGMGEAIATVASGAVAEPVGGLVGMATTPVQGLPQGVRNIEATTQALTYQPRSQLGQQVLGGVAQTLEPIGRPLQAASNYLGERGFEAGGAPLGAIGQTIIPAALEAIPGFRAIRTTRTQRMPEPTVPPVQPSAPGQPSTPGQPSAPGQTSAAPESFDLGMATRQEAENIDAGLRSARRGQMANLASQVQADTQIMKDAEALGISLNPAHYSTSRAYIDMENALKSRLGVELAANEEKAIRDLGIQADRLIQDFGGFTDRDLLNSSVRSNFKSTIDGLKAKSNRLYDAVDGSIPAELRVTPQNAIAYLDEQKRKLGGSVGLLNKAERDLNKLLGNPKTPPTYFALNRVRINIGRALGGEDSPYSSIDKKSLSEAYDVLSRDQLNVADAFGVGDDLRDAQSLVSRRKDLEDASIEILGKELRDSILPRLTQSATGLTKGDATKLENMMQALPAELRPQAAATLLGDLFVSGGRRSSEMSAGFVGVFRALDRNKSAKDLLFSYLPEEARTRFDMIGRVATGIYRAKGLENTSRSARDVIAALESGGLIEKIYGVGKRSLAAEGVSSTVGLPGIGTAVTVANAIAEKATPAVEAADALLASRQFQRAIQSHAAGAVNEAELALKNSPQYQQWLRAQNANIRADVVAMGLIPWLLQTSEEE